MDPQADDAKFAETKTPPPAFEKDTPASEKELLTEVACPELGWAKRKRESEMSWYARIQAFRHGSEKKKQKFYHEQWSGFDQKHKERFRKEIEAKLFPEQPVFAPKQTNAKAAGSKQGLVAWRQVQDDGRSVVHLPSGYTICALTKDFQEYAANPVAHDQKRWEMYALIFLFMSSGDPPFHNAAQAVQALPELRLNKHYLGKLKKLFGDSKLPWECPAEFRVGRTPRASLSQAELEDVLLFVKWSQRTGCHLTIQQVEDAITLMKLEKRLASSICL